MLAGLTNNYINAVSVELLDDEFELVKEIEQQMKDNIGSGVGIAAVQIGILKRIIIIKVNGEFITLVNPVIVSKSADKKLSKERCLSFPDKFVKKQRHYRVTLHGLTVDKQGVVLRLSSNASYIAQHEMDHLDGIHI